MLMYEVRVPQTISKGSPKEVISDWFHCYEGKVASNMQLIQTNANTQNLSEGGEIYNMIEA